MDKTNIINNPIAQGAIAALIAAFVIWLISFLINKKHENTIVNFLKQSSQNTDHTFRTTHAISSKLNISEDKIRKICTSSNKIKRNEKKKESWRLT